jgi:PAS domain-containing protein
MNALSLKMKALSTLATFCAKLKSPGKFIRFLESVLNAIPTPVFIKTDPSTYLYVNTAFTEFVHKSKEEVFNRPYTEVKAVELENRVLCTGESVMYMNEYTSYQGRNMSRVHRITNGSGLQIISGNCNYCKSVIYYFLMIFELYGLISAKELWISW